jgi:hypothetical protein
MDVIARKSSDSIRPICSSDCWDAVPDGGVYDPSADGITAIEFEAPAGAVPSEWAFCVNSVSL